MYLPTRPVAAQQICVDSTVRGSDAVPGRNVSAGCPYVEVRWPDNELALLQGMPSLTILKVL